jgi:O-methyltransferase
MDIFELCKQNTIASEKHLLDLKKILLHVNQNMIGGDIVECGAGKSGCCMWLAASELEASFIYGRNIYLYDVFDISNNITSDDSEPTKSYYVRFQENTALPYTDSVDPPVPINQTITNMSTIGYPADKMHYIMGDVCDTLDSIHPELIAVLRLDTESYESTKKELDILFPKVNSGGYIILHYSSREAIDELLAEYSDTITVICNEPIPGYVILVKYPNAINIFEEPVPEPSTEPVGEPIPETAF